MAKTNRFHVRDFEENIITVEEGRKERSPLALFFIKNGKLLFAISFLFSVAVFIIAFALVLSNMEESTIVKYESNGVIVSFDGTDNSILNGTPITDEYAEKIFDSTINISTSEVGVVIKVDDKELEDRTIVFYSDKSALIKYNSGGYMKVSSVNGENGVNEDGVIDRKAITKKVTGVLEENKNLGITILSLSDGSIEITKDNTTFFVRNNDVTNTNDILYTNLSGVSLPIKKENGYTYYSDGTMKKANYIIVNDTEYKVKEDKNNAYDNIKVIYYENGYAEVVKDTLSIIVRNSDHIVYNDKMLEIVDNSILGVEIKDIMDIKEITLNNTNEEISHYIIVLEETNDYAKHDVSRRLDNSLINFNIYVGGNKIYNNVLNNNLKGTNRLEGLNLDNNTYLLYEGNIEKLSSETIKLGLWIDYNDIGNEYMNSALIGTVKVYVESLS